MRFFLYVIVCFSSNFYLFPSVNNRTRRTFFSPLSVVLSTLQTVIFRVFSSVFCNACYAKAVHIKRAKYAFFCRPENGKNRYILYSVNFCRFKSKWIWKLAKSKMHECPACAPCCFGMFWNNSMNEEGKIQINKLYKQSTSALILRLHT